MKATINGVDFEGTPEEFKAFMSDSKEKTVVLQVPKLEQQTKRIVGGAAVCRKCGSASKPCRCGYVRKTGSRRVRYGLRCDVCGKEGMNSVGLGVHKSRNKDCRKIARAGVARRRQRDTTQHAALQGRAKIGRGLEWTVPDEKMLREKYPVMGAKCAKLLGRTEKSVTWKAGKLGLKFRNIPGPAVTAAPGAKLKTRYHSTRKSVVGGNAHKAWTPEQDAVLKDLKMEGLSRRKISAEASKKLSRTKKAVNERINKLISRGDWNRVRDSRAEALQSVRDTGFGFAATERLRSDAVKEAINAVAADKFPDLEHCKEKKIAAQIFKHAAVTHGTLNYSQDGYAFGIEDGEQWREFCEDVLCKTEIIREVMGYTPKLTRVGRGITISFERV